MFEFCVRKRGKKKEGKRGIRDYNYLIKDERFLVRYFWGLKAINEEK